MNAMEWTTIDRKEWPAGPWDGEPDKVQWKDAATGLPCIAVRHNHSGHWCGYVGVAEGHPAHGVKYDGVDKADAEDSYLDVHGGLTYSALCEPLGDEIGEGICHIAAPGEPENVWWLGFDCAHSGDYSPADAMRARDRPESCWRISDRDSYKGLGYVKAECTKLAAQLVGPLKITPRSD